MVLQRSKKILDSRLNPPYGCTPDTIDFNQTEYAKWKTRFSSCDSSRRPTV
jgi:hypothetical protein